ncbi:hypothetical protein QR680_013808 [Steinernema hermaphroditum]|uniref:Uncharacterized protein n=1 Tax=Steinernema hermaphroditum TaxID=289476 RepID=A0AA39I9I8_9BILA|nr:hypothetical protein QR680_013808 [Steinernema hermaphroditum]
MKTVLFLSILIAASIAAPQTRSAFDKLKDNNFLSKLQPDSNGFYSKESFGYVLAILNSLLNQSDSAFVPEEIRSFVANLTVEDYEAIKYLHSFGTRIGSGNITGSEMVNSSLTFMTRHPDFNRRMQSSLFGLLRRLKELSSTTKGYMVNSYLLIKHPASKKPMGRGLTLVRYYLTWPQENRDEFELIFPKLSEKASALTPLFNLYKDEFSYPSDLPDCAASDEKPVRCSKFINAMNFEMFLGKDTDMDELEQLKKDLNEMLKN